MISTLTHVTQTLNKFNLRPKKKFGQNFLIDTNIVRKIVSDVNDNNVAIEIGPGLGALSEILIEKYKKVYLFEIDKDMYYILNETFKEKKNIEITLCDFLDVDLKRFENQKLSVYSNLPYYVTTPILFKLFNSNLDIDSITVMMQKEVKQRFVAKVSTSDYSALSIICQYLYNIEDVVTVSRNVFYPKPDVESAVIKFIPKRKRDFKFESKFFNFIQMCFVQRRKTLYNNLKCEFKKDKIELMYNNLNLDLNIRSQDINEETFISIFKELYDR